MAVAGCVCVSAQGVLLVKKKEGPKAKRKKMKGERSRGGAHHNLQLFGVGCGPHKHLCVSPTLPRARSRRSVKFLERGKEEDLMSVCVCIQTFSLCVLDVFIDAGTFFSCTS